MRRRISSRWKGRPAELPKMPRVMPLLRIARWHARLGWAKKGVGRKGYDRWSSHFKAAPTSNVTPTINATSKATMGCYYDCTHFCGTGTPADALVQLPIWKQLYKALVGGRDPRVDAKGRLPVHGS